MSVLEPNIVFDTSMMEVSFADDKATGNSKKEIEEKPG